MPSCVPQTADRGQRGRDMEVYDVITVCAFDITETFFVIFFELASPLFSAYLVF